MGVTVLRSEMLKIENPWRVSSTSIKSNIKQSKPTVFLFYWLVDKSWAIKCVLPWEISCWTGCYFRYNHELQLFVASVIDGISVITMPLWNYTTFALSQAVFGLALGFYVTGRYEFSCLLCFTKHDLNIFSLISDLHKVPDPLN